MEYAGKILNELGIWTSKYRFKAVFQKGMCPPARFRLGTVNIDCFFQGMPEFCRRCRQYGHLAEGCELCQNCGKAGHEFKTCSLPKRCNFCLQEGHLYSKCPQRKDKPEKIVKPAGKLTIVESVTSGEESEPRQVSQEGPTVKRTKKEEKTKEDGSSGSSRVSTPAKSSKSVSKSVSKSLSKGEKLYQYYKDKPDREVREFFEEWSDEEDFDRIKGQMKGLTQNEIREMVLGHIRNLK
eukprot:XP_017945739.1 PREDICTED: uncharacterized protein LOC100490809 [Xenopus tropicalis]